MGSLAIASLAMVTSAVLLIATNMAILTINYTMGLIDKEHDMISVENSIRKSSIKILRITVSADGRTVTLEISNEGSIPIKDYELMDVILKYTLIASGAERVFWFPYSPAGDENSWGIEGISEVVNLIGPASGSLDPGETALITVSLSVDMAVDVNKPVTAAVSTPEGSSDTMSV